MYRCRDTGSTSKPFVLLMKFKGRHKCACVVSDIKFSLQGIYARKSEGNACQGMSGILVLSVSAAVIGSSTQFGYNTGVINSPKQVKIKQKVTPTCTLISKNNCILVHRQFMTRSIVMTLISMPTSLLLK